MGTVQKRARNGRVFGRTGSWSLGEMPDELPNTSLSGYRFTLPVEVRFRDIDAFGHVNNVVYLTYMESARIAYWMHVTGHQELTGLTMILARTEVDYRSPVAFGERLVVGVRCASTRRSSFVLEFAVEAVGDPVPPAEAGAQGPTAGARRLVAEARKVLVHYDYAAGRPVPLTPELRAQLKAQDPGLREE